MHVSKNYNYICDDIIDTPGHAALTEKSLLYEPDKVNDSGKTSKVINRTAACVSIAAIVCAIIIANGLISCHEELSIDHLLHLHNYAKSAY